MSLLLCHECLSWVEPADDRCPDCQEPLDVDAPDPHPSQLTATIGDLLAPLGPAAIARKKLPSRGLLYETTNGLFFLPHRTELTTELVETTAVGSPLMWTLASLIFTPLSLVAPFVREKKLKPQRVEVTRPVFLRPEESRRLAELLMENPGVFFIARNSIRIITCRRKKWVIERLHGTTLKLMPESDGADLNRRLQEMVACDRWRNVAVIS